MSTRGTTKIPPRFRTGEALVVFDLALRVVDWNEAAEELTGRAAEDVLGTPCWQALGGIAPDGEVVCHAGCSVARLGREGWPVTTRELLIRGESNRLRVSVTTVALADRDTQLVAHLMRPAPDAASTDSCPAGKPPALSRRQREILELLAEGYHAKEISRRLGLADSTVRNHIHALLKRLDCRSQLQALAKARALSLV